MAFSHQGSASYANLGPKNIFWSQMQTAVLLVVGITESGDPTGMDFRHITPSSSNGALRLLLSLIRQ
jgi:hypothetical protein